MFTFGLKAVCINEATDRDRQIQRNLKEISLPIYNQINKHALHHRAKV
jgi:hypothetical protein